MLDCNELLQTTKNDLAGKYYAVWGLTLLYCTVLTDLYC